MGSEATRGILRPDQGFAHFELTREPPALDLAQFVEGSWCVRWDLRGRPSYTQEILPYPCVNVAFEGQLFAVHGPGTKRFTTELSGRGYAWGMKFTPAGFSAFSRLPMRTLVDRVLPLHEVTCRPAPRVTDESPAALRVLLEEHLRSFAATRSEASALVDGLVAQALRDRAIARADDLARLAGTSLRSLHRLFEQRVGVSPKWVVRRARVQDAAERVAHGEHVDWARVARELGYHDQAHMIRDFRAQVGFTPAAYARRCALHTRPQPSERSASAIGSRPP